MNVDEIYPLKTIMGETQRERSLGWWRNDTIQTANDIDLGHVQVKQRPKGQIEYHTTSYFPVPPIEPDACGWGGSVMGSNLEWLIRQWRESPKGLDECEARVRAVAEGKTYVVQRPFGLMVGEVGYYDKRDRIKVVAMDEETITINTGHQCTWDPREWQKMRDGKDHKAPENTSKTFAIPKSVFMNLVRQETIVLDVVPAPNPPRALFK